jgi:hypothetical protein
MSTLDLSAIEPNASAADSRPVERCLRIVYHADLRRVGDELRLDPRSTTTIGRASPDFTSL